MKASLKFSEDQKYLVRAKVPISVLGLPFLSGICAGGSKELSLNLSTFFESGPSFKFSYRPNDSPNPFGIVVKTGIGSFGSPIDSPFSITADFSLLGHENPKFFVHFKPRLGDFSLKTSTGSAIMLPPEYPIFGPKVKNSERDLDSDGEISTDGETPRGNGTPPGNVTLRSNSKGFHSENGNIRPGNDIFLQENGGFRSENGNFRHENGIISTVKEAGSDLQSIISTNKLFSGTEFMTSTSLPVRSTVNIKFRWGVRFPQELCESIHHSNPIGRMSLKNFPFLVMNKISNGRMSPKNLPFFLMNKISIEHVPENMNKKKTPTKIEQESTQTNELSEVCSSLRRQIEALHAEDDFLRKSVEELRSIIMPPKQDHRMNNGKSGGGKKDGRKWTPEFESAVGKSKSEEPNKEIK